MFEGRERERETYFGETASTESVFEHSNKSVQWCGQRVCINQCINVLHLQAHLVLQG